MTLIYSLSRICTILTALAVPLAAGSLSFTGTFTEDDDEAMFSFDVPAQETVVMRTWSYAGGTNAAGATILFGGFDPVLTLFDTTGNWQGANNDGTGMVATDGATGSALDSYLSLNLAAGGYQLFLTESDNTAVDALLSDGFTQSGQGNFTCPEFYGSPGSFCDATPAIRNGNYAVDIVYADGPATGTPEPGTASLLMLAAATAALSRCRGGSHRQ